MVDYKTLEKVAKQLQNFQESPFSTFGLKSDLRYEDPMDLTSLMVKHEMKGLESYSEQILLEMGKLMSTQGNANKRVAVVGPQGVGKTTFMLDLSHTLNDQKNKAQFKFLREVKCFSPIPLKMLIDKKFDFLGSIDPNFKSKFVLLLDDCQELFYPDDDDSIRKDSFESLNRKLNSFDNSLFVFNFNAFGWKMASTKIPDISNYFEKIIWMEGLAEDELIDAIKKRLDHFSINDKKKVSVPDIFEEEILLKEIIKYSAGNPRLAIALVSLGIIGAVESKKNKIDKETISKVLEEEGFTQLKSLSTEDLLKNRTLYSLLANNFMPIKVISQFSGLNRTTINKELESTTNKSRLKSIRNPLNKKENIYGLKRIIRAALERSLMDKLEKKAESIRVWSSDQMKV